MKYKSSSIFKAGWWTHENLLHFSAYFVCLKPSTGKSFKKQNKRYWLFSKHLGLFYFLFSCWFLIQFSVIGGCLCITWTHWNILGIVLCPCIYLPFWLMFHVFLRKKNVYYAVVGSMFYMCYFSQLC